MRLRGTVGLHGACVVGQVVGRDMPAVAGNALGHWAVAYGTKKNS